MNEQTTQTTQTAGEQTIENPISVGDLILMFNIISTTSRRGAFDAAEFSVVGSLYEKLRQYVPAQKEEPEPETETENTSVDQDQLAFNFEADAD